MYYMIVKGNKFLKGFKKESGVELPIWVERKSICLKYTEPNKVESERNKIKDICKIKEFK